jgi:glycosyltransferase involved in cell wall biosynthesis
MIDKVSIVLPCLNEENFLGLCLKSLVDQDYPVNLIEIIVIDGGSSDRSIIIANEFQSRNKNRNIIILSNPDKYTPLSLNIGIRKSTGDYIMIASSHAQFPTDYVSKLINYIQENTCDCAGGAIDTRSIIQSSKANAIVKILSSGAGVGNSKFRIEKKKIMDVDTVPFGIYKRIVFEKIGLYNEKLLRNQDIEFSKRMIDNGYKITLVPTVQSIYYARDTYSKFAWNNFRNGFWNIITFYMTKRIRSLSIRHFVPLFFILSLLLPIIIGVFTDQKVMIVSIVSLILYLIFILKASWNLRSSESKFIHLFLCFIILHVSYGSGSLIALFRIDKLLF